MIAIIGHNITKNKEKVIKTFSSNRDAAIYGSQLREYLKTQPNYKTSLGFAMIGYASHNGDDYRFFYKEI